MLLSSLGILPTVAYVYLQSRRSQSQASQSLIEEEGRKAWEKKDALRKVGENDGNDKSFAVRVGRSGGGI